MPTNQSAKNALSELGSGKLPVLGLQYPTCKPATGEKIPRAKAQTAPELSVANLAEGTYLVVALDLDAPFVSWPHLGPILHWIQPGLKPQPTSDGTAVLKSDTPFVANYIGPAPPPLAAPHRYTFYLYAQPANFDHTKYAPAGGKELSNFFRMRYDLDAFEKKAGLGPILAANYFVSN